MDTAEALKILKLFMENKATSAEIEDLFSWLRKKKEDEVLELRLEDFAALIKPDENYDPNYWEPVIGDILNNRK